MSVIQYGENIPAEILDVLLGNITPAQKVAVSRVYVCMCCAVCVCVCVCVCVRVRVLYLCACMDNMLTLHH